MYIYICININLWILIYSRKYITSFKYLLKCKFRIKQKNECVICKSFISEFTGLTKTHTGMNTPIYKTIYVGLYEYLFSDTNIK